LTFGKDLLILALPPPWGGDFVEAAMQNRNTKPSPAWPAHQIFVFGLLFVTWMILSGFFDPFHLTLGVISCGLVTIISADLLFEHRDTPILFRFRQAGRLIAYLFWLLWQVVLANYHILKLAMGSKDRVQPQFVRCKTSLKSDFEKYLLANSITLTPGTVTTKIIGDTFYIHAIDDVSAAGLEGEMERRIAHIFSTAPKGSTSGES
jgi:multicomponent Na+:H+ antiporter subunit E